MQFDRTLHADRQERLHRATKTPARKHILDRDQADEHAGWMRQAIELARAMQGWVWPNPAVGCLIVRDGMIVGRGQTRFGGRPHAERIALDDAAELARGATLYVTLEPCCHWGKTPPCADAIIEAGVSRVYASIQDPDPRVNGGGFSKLREAGVETHVGLGADEALGIMAGFFHRIETGKPLVTVCQIDEETFDIPQGYDGVIQSRRDKIWLFTRAPGVGTKASQLLCPDYASGSILRRLGELGLTSVCVPADDRLSETLANASGG
ncbi:bifunctional diaminohydroxyphosphoribosylaminopyrimidine deaminase/5-amino-6-(5-phosphoribosylamino)uracil reductase RibD [Hoeflea sp. CAU 1731]